MKVLVIGSGGREHALCWKLSQSKDIDRLYCAPGNAGISKLAQCVKIRLGQEGYIAKLANFVKKEGIELTVVGPEAPLVDGITNYFKTEGLSIFGPTKEGALIEGSKVFAKRFMEENNILTPKFEVFDDETLAKDYIKKVGPPLVIKADGLAGGKGSLVCHSEEEAYQAVERLMVKKEFKTAGERIVIEGFEQGEEVSILAFTDGEDVFILPSSQDHKRAFDGDRGPNTGGMGAYAPTPVITKDLEDNIKEDILKPTLLGLKQIGIEYVGVIYLGLIITKEGVKLLEYNVRFGDPETQAILPLLNTDLLSIIEACILKSLRRVKAEFSPNSALCVVIASGGYPEDYEVGKEIKGMEEVEGMEDVLVFHAGTEEREGRIITSGGRVLGVTGLGRTLKEAAKTAYLACSKLSFENMHYRKDIGYRALGRE